ncbi:hypothetical protein JNUCC31_20780 [Paenibacillus sp. JNUCC31]|uniref:hypothetical protein n=1 Tax=Paenibacillus sp. JNUCC-31 TaxID=2777983 RepID=UPI0017854FC8|nr:hypothetical protein [Paenibacillus sp. JNUCC-31]QOS77230.1 hypothetical protein JNUCC31_20780 [Paenibacillus sp. JNUCC-31]
MIQQRKPLGVGTLSLLVLAMGFAFNFSWGTEKVQISHYLFNLLDLPIYSNGHQGFHIPFMAAVIFWLSSVLIARKYHSHYGTKVAYKVGGFMLILSVMIFPLYGVIWVIFH